MDKIKKLIWIPSLNQRWLMIFGLWILFLSGALPQFVGSPGIIQALRLHALLKTKEQQRIQLHDELKKLQTEAALLEQNRYFQEREIRKVLGYAAADEIIFDFF